MKQPKFKIGDIVIIDELKGRNQGVVVRISSEHDTHFYEVKLFPEKIGTVLAGEYQLKAVQS